MNSYVRIGIVARDQQSTDRFLLSAVIPKDESLIRGVISPSGGLRNSKIYIISILLKCKFNILLVIHIKQHVNNP